MRLSPLYLGIVASLTTTVIAPVFAQDQLLQDVVVSASRFEQRSFDAPGSIQSVGRDVIESGGPQINISEALNSVPGINAANRNNYSQDLQISIRGFGSRAPFGVRGVRLLIDGIPQTLPDGQGQSSQFALTSAERIEVLKGPISLLYGNASGGVVQVITKSAGDKPEFSAYGFAGRDDLYHSGAQYSEKKGAYGFVADVAHFSSNGFRDYSSATRDHFNGKIDIDGDRSKTTIVMNVLHNKSEEPGSLTLGEYNTNPRQAVAANVAGKYGKEFTQSMVGLSSEVKAGANQAIFYRAYYGARNLDNPLAPSTSPTGFSMVDRANYGIGFGLRSRNTIGSTTVLSVIGVDADYVKDTRTARVNTAGVATGVQGRNEDNIASSTGLYMQSELLLSEKWSALIGARITQVKLEVKDYFTTDTSGDGSGSKTYHGLSPVLGLTRHLTPELHLFAQTGRGFETPTLNEVLYSPSGATSTAKFYGQINPAKNTQGELGLKWRPNNLSRLDASVFIARTRDDIIPLYLSTSNSTWQNVDTKRYGAEIAASTIIAKYLQLRGAATWIEAKYIEAATTAAGDPINSGNKMPGVPESKIFADLSYRSSGWGSRVSKSFSESGIEVVSVGRVMANSINTERTSAYELLNLRMAQYTRVGPGVLSLTARVDNVTDRKYVSSVVVDQVASRYYEPGAPRSWLLGLKYTLTM